MVVRLKLLNTSDSQAQSEQVESSKIQQEWNEPQIGAKCRFCKVDGSDCFKWSPYIDCCSQCFKLPERRYQTINKFRVGYNEAIRDGAGGVRSDVAIRTVNSYERRLLKSGLSPDDIMLPMEVKVVVKDHILEGKEEGLKVGGMVIKVKPKMETCPECGLVYDKEVISHSHTKETLIHFQEKIDTIFMANRGYKIQKHLEDGRKPLEDSQALQDKLDLRCLVKCKVCGMNVCTHHEHYFRNVFGTEYFHTPHPEYNSLARDDEIRRNEKTGLRVEFLSKIPILDANSHATFCYNIL